MHGGCYPLIYVYGDDNSSGRKEFELFVFVFVLILFFMRISIYYWDRPYFPHE